MSDESCVRLRRILTEHKSAQPSGMSQTVPIPTVQGRSSRGLSTEEVTKADSARLGLSDKQALKLQLKKARNVKESQSPPSPLSPTQQQPRERKDLFIYAHMDTYEIEMSEVFSYFEWKDLHRAASVSMKISLSECLDVLEDFSSEDQEICFCLDGVLGWLLRYSEGSLDSRATALHEDYGIMHVLSPHLCSSHSVVFDRAISIFLILVISHYREPRGSFLGHVLRMSLSGSPVVEWIASNLSRSPRKLAMLLRGFVLAVAIVDQVLPELSKRVENLTASALTDPSRFVDLKSGPGDLEFAASIAKEHFGPNSLALDRDGVHVETYSGIPVQIGEALDIIEQSTPRNHSEKSYVNGKPLLHTEKLYQAILPQLDSLVKFLLVCLPLCVEPFSKSKTLKCDASVEKDILLAEELSALPVDKTRHKEIILKALTSSIYLLLVLFKHNRILINRITILLTLFAIDFLQFLHLRETLISNSALEALTKTLNTDIVQVLSKTSEVKGLGLFSHGAWEPTVVADICQASIKTRGKNWRGFYAITNTLMILQKLTKHSFVNACSLAKVPGSNVWV